VQIGNYISDIKKGEGKEEPKTKDNWLVETKEIE
jgi:hypothetical protein